MKNLTYSERVAVMRVLMDIVLADNRVDYREDKYFNELLDFFQLPQEAKLDVEKQNSLLALTLIHDFSQEQKEEFAKLMGNMIVVDGDINYNEVKIYNVVNEFCGINLDFCIDDYPHFSHSL